jgi:hypothetical protein
MAEVRGIGGEKAVQPRQLGVNGAIAQAEIHDAGVGKVVAEDQLAEITREISCTNATSRGLSRYGPGFALLPDERRRVL